MRRGINKKNYEYWRDEIFVGLQKQPLEIASLMAHRICHEQEIELFKERIIKLEKKLKK
jgi:hypothetical protein